MPPPPILYVTDAVEVKVVPHKINSINTQAAVIKCLIRLDYIITFLLHAQLAFNEQLVCQNKLLNSRDNTQLQRDPARMTAKKQNILEQFLNEFSTVYI